MSNEVIKTKNENYGFGDDNDNFINYSPSPFSPQIGENVKRLYNNITKAEIND